MQNDALIFIRFIFIGLFFLTLFAGGYLFRNHERLFGVDPNMPSENASARGYSCLQILCVWGHAVLLTGAFALLLH